MAPIIKKTIPIGIKVLEPETPSAMKVIPKAINGAKEYRIGSVASSKGVD
jgi:hypothetical protein